MIELKLGDDVYNLPALFVPSIPYNFFSTATIKDKVF